MFVLYDVVLVERNNSRREFSIIGRCKGWGNYKYMSKFKKKDYIFFYEVYFVDSRWFKVLRKYFYIICNLDINNIYGIGNIKDGRKWNYIV